MMVARESVHRRPRYRAPWFLAVGMLIALAAGCAPSAPMPPIPADLPLTANQDIFTIRWALQKEPTVTRAVGTLTTSNVTPTQVTMGLFGLDSGGSIVSRGAANIGEGILQRHHHLLARQRLDRKLADAGRGFREFRGSGFCNADSH